MAANDLTTLAALETYLGLSAGNGDEPVLAALITAASQHIETVCGRLFASQACTDIRDGTGGTRLVLRNTPVTAVSSLLIDWLSIPASSGYAAGAPPSPGYIVQENGRLDLLGHRFTRGRANVIVNYTAGYATIPADLAQACNELVGHEFREIKRLGKSSESLAAGQATSFIIREMPPRVAAIVTRYTRVAPGYP